MCINLIYFFYVYQFGSILKILIQLDYLH